jgi:putative aldouronate transport system substrate-binding protein
VVNGETNQQTYPLSQEKITLSYWYPMAGSQGELDDFNNGDFWKWYEEKTNIHIDFIVPAANAEKDAFNLLFASDDMPDIVYSNVGLDQNNMVYRGGEDKAIDDGYFIDMAENMEFAPNYWSWIENGEASGYKRAVHSDAGKIYGFWSKWLPVFEDVMPERGVAIRSDLLKKVGMEVPTTYDEWEAVLRAFKDQLGVEAPLYSSKYGVDVQGDFMAGFETAPYFYQKDGKVQYGPLDDGYKEYLTLMNKWYSEGLLDKDFPTRSSTGTAPDNDMILNDKIGAMTSDWATRMSDTYISRGAINPELYLVAAPQPTKGADGPAPHYRTVTGPDDMTGSCTLISADSKYIEQAIRWVDGFYAKDVYLNANYGVEAQEGVVWQAKEDGGRIGNYDFRYSNPDGLSSATVLVKYWTKNPPIRSEAAQYEQADENKQASYRTWATYDAEWVLPSRIILTSDENTQYSSLYTDILTYVQESNVKFITGSLSLDTYDSYRDTLRSMGIEECIALKQAGLDRYLAR